MRHLRQQSCVGCSVAIGNPSGDGVGARVSGNVGAYIVWLFLLDAAMMLLFGFWQVGARRMGEATRDAWVMILLGGALSTASYAIAIWAMTKAPIAPQSRAA